MNSHHDSDPTLDYDILRRWIGKQRSVTDTIRPQPVALMRATLDQPATAPQQGDPLPYAWHWLFFLEAAPLRELDRDGHAARGNFLPPVALPRRMWAGGRLRFIEPIRIGERITRQSTIKNVVRKSGRSGELCFVTVAHEFIYGSILKMSEQHDIVYRQDPDENAPAPTPPAVPENLDKSIRLTPTSIMLFRYSALTFNSHRIHYDLDYCRNVERYSGLVVHGPLTATLLAGMASDHYGDIKLSGFEFRAISPLFADQQLTIASKQTSDSNGRQLKLWGANPRGEIGMTATALV